jgi:hypothetical protein
LPDINLIEHIWAYFKKKLKKCVVKKNKPELISKFKEIWNDILKEYIGKLMDSMAKRIEGIIRANCGNTSY